MLVPLLHPLVECFYPFNLKSSAIISELPGVNKKIDKPININPITPENITFFLNKELYLTAWITAPTMKKIPMKRIIK